MSEDEFAALRERFRERTRGQAKDLRARLAEGDLQAPEIERIVHSLAGTGAMLGFDELAASAAAIDDQYVAGQAPSRETLEALALAMEALS